MHLYCQCLNVTIDALEIIDDQDILAHFTPVDNTSQEWSVCSLLSDQSIHVAWQSLFQSIPVRDMKLHRCLACNQYTHVTNIESTKILINKDLNNDETIKHVYSDPNYSKITKILLPNRINSPTMTRLAGSQDENSQRECEVAQQLYRQSLEDAERDVEEKIRMYQREQEQLLKTKTEEIKKELETFLSAIRSASRHTSNTKTSPTLQTSSSYINENSMESGVGSDIFDVNGTDLSRQSSTLERTLSERVSYPEDETNDDPMLDNTGWFNSTSNFATSVPKTIAFRPASNYAIPQHNDDDAENDDLERIGKSFRELSQSLMCTDGTELFGDLPSPRLSARPT